MNFVLSDDFDATSYGTGFESKGSKVKVARFESISMPVYAYSIIAL